MSLRSEDEGCALDLPPKQIAIVGTGFAGMTMAAGLLKKRVNAEITLFERRDAILPLQHGSDSRWLHPHIYDWPRSGSEAFSAALPVLNWTASRASDVVVQVQREWARVVTEAALPAPDGTVWALPTVNVYCNTSHIKVSEGLDSDKLMIEWIGERRAAANPSIPADSRASAVGESQSFDCVILAVGFGLESGARPSYWRNETLAQPHLGQARETYIVSGSGDGAMVDLFRLRISDYRQDRILGELFTREFDLLGRLRGEDSKAPGGIAFEQLQSVWQDESLAHSTARVLANLRGRLRQDTAVILTVRRQNFTTLFDGNRVSFQNRLLAYLLYRCGAFTFVIAPSDRDVRRVATEYGVAPERVIFRRGIRDFSGLTDPLAISLREKVAICVNDHTQYRQSDMPLWRGGYFDTPGVTEAEQALASDLVKATWRKEYLPSPMEAIAATFCSAVAGLVVALTNSSARLRVTLHRTLIAGDEVVLQQCCDYQGVDDGAVGGQAGRTFPSHNGTIGAAFGLGRVVRTKPGATSPAIVGDMAMLSLNVASKTMSTGVSSIVAIPLLGSPNGRLPGQSQNVVGVLYLDSYDADVFIGEAFMRQLIRMCQSFLVSVSAAKDTVAGRIANTEFWGREALLDLVPPAVDPGDWQALQVVDIDAPNTLHLGHLNFDYSDFTPVEKT